MPRKGKPFYDASRNQWILRTKLQMPDGSWKRRHFLCSGADNEALAWSKAAELIGDPVSITGKPRTITEACDIWLKLNGSAWHEAILAPFMAWTVGIGFNDVHAETLCDYLKHLKKVKYERPKDSGKWHHYAPSTIRRQMRFARTVLTWASVRKYLTEPVPPMPRLPKIPRIAKDIRPATLRKIFGKLPAQAKQVLSFMAMTGARPDEACLLKYSEIEGDRCVLHRGKTWERTGEARIIYLNEEARELIERQPTMRGYVFRNRQGTPYKPSGLRSIIMRSASKVGVELSGAYQIRHSWAQYALDNGLISLDALGEALGHEPGSPATKVYARISQARTQKEVQSLVSPISDDQSLTTARVRFHEEKTSRKKDQPSRGRSGKARRPKAG